MKNKLTLVVLLLLPALAMAFSGGPPNGRTGAPGEGTCVSCHSSFPINSGDGVFSINAPETFEPGQTYPITVELSDPGQSRWGFEITPLDQGSVTIIDEINTQAGFSGNNSYVKQTSTGTFNGNNDGPVSWTFDWTAPDDPLQIITFYAAGNGANGNGNTSGDYIYTTSFTSELNTTGVDDLFVDKNALPSKTGMESYPNPFNSRVNFRYTLPNEERIQLNIYDITGKLVAKLIDEVKPAGTYIASWDSKDANHKTAASGVYIVRLTSQTQVVANRIVMLK